MRTKILGGLAALVLFALLGLDAQAQYTVVGRGIQRIFIGSTEQRPVSALTLPSGSTCDGGVCTVAGGGSAPTGCQRGYVPVIADDAGTLSCISTLTIDPATGNVTASSGVTFDGYDISAIGAKVEGLPAAAVAVASTVPQEALDGGGNGQVVGVQLIIKGSGGATYSNDASYMMPSGQCSVSVPTNRVARFIIQWTGTHYTQWDAGAPPSGYCTVRRTYTVRNTNGVLSTPNALLGETDQPAGTTCTGGAAVDGGVVQPYPQGPSATLVRWECAIEQLSYTAS